MLKSHIRHRPVVNGVNYPPHRSGARRIPCWYRRARVLRERARKQYGAEIRRRLELERLAASLSSRMLSEGIMRTDRAERDVRLALGEIGAAFDADYCFLHLLPSDPPGEIIERGYEWHVDGIAPIAEQLVGQPGSAFSFMGAEFKNKNGPDSAGVVIFPDLMAESAEVRRLGVQAMAFIPLYIGAHLIGYCGLRSRHSCSSARWPAADLRQLKLMGEVIANTLLAVSAAERLVSECNMLQSLIDALPHTLYAKDTAGRFIACNRAAAALDARTPEEVLGTTDWDATAYDPDAAQSYSNDEQNVIETGIPLLEYEETVRDYTGRLRWFSSTKTPLRDDSGRIVGIVGMGRDITDQRATMEALRENLTRFRVLFEDAAEGIALFRVVYDADNYAVNYEYQDINKRHELIMGISRDACIGRKITEVLSVTTPPYLQEFVAVAVTGVPYRIEHYSPVLSKYLYVSAFQISPGCFATLTIDITATKQAEAELRQATALYRDIFENATMGVFRSTPDGRFLFVNAAMARIYGYDTPQEMRDLVGSNILTCIYAHPSHRAGFKRILDSAGTLSNFEAQHRRKDGTVIWTRCNARTTWSAPGVPLYYDGILEDITAQKETERALQYRESQFRFLAESMHDVIWTLNNEHRFTYISPSILLLRGLEPAEALREGYLDAYTPESRNIIRNAAAQRSEAEAAGRMDSVFYLELQQYHRDGTLLWVELLMQALLDEQGRRTGFLGITRDITARKLADEELQYASTHDVLTGRVNRAGFEKEITRLCREGSFPFSVILADVNGLKLTNDLRGHAAGDELIRRAAQVLVTGCRNDALVARYGGDEFAVLLPETSAVAARAAVLLVQAEIHTHNAESADQAFGLAIGVATATGPMNSDELMSIVDARMYEDKRRHKI